MLVIKLTIHWRTPDSQGPDYPDIVSHETMYCDSPILDSQINREVYKLYGPLVSKIEKIIHVYEVEKE